MTDAKTGTATGETGAEQGSGTPRAADRILGVARDLFYSQGIRAIGVDEIVRQAGVTKPSLYRSFASKDDLAASYLQRYERDFWARFDAAVAAHPGDPRAQVVAYFTGVGQRAGNPGHRGCGLTNAVVEYPEAAHPAHRVSEANKRELRRRLRAMAAEMGAVDPDVLGDGLLLLFEGANISGQIFGPDGPAASLGANADRLIAASLPAPPRQHLPNRPALEGAVGMVRPGGGGSD